MGEVDPVAAAAIEHELERLKTIPLTGLRSYWAERWGYPPAIRSVGLLRLMIAWRLQAELFGGLDAETRRLLRQNTIPQPRLPTGSRLTREYRGVLHHVEVGDHVFHYAGRDFSSLSKVAEAITDPLEWTPVLRPARRQRHDMSEPGPLRCAIYTRKSSEEGLQQAFNSLRAQREACEAYIRSQAGEGWVMIGDRYDDGGHSGGTMARPALRRLLEDVQAGRVDVVLVYKVDRLTRSLPDFARIIELLDVHRVAFASITQAFNTTSSAGRLTLNVLLSFAQFEREVTGERIRDKIAASKAKGMWMGGNIPLGYDAPSDDRRVLVVNPDEAARVRLIFARFLEAGGLFQLQKRLTEDGVRSKRWISTRGRLMGGFPFSRGALRHLLRNRVYMGEITHKDSTHPGRHAAIVDQGTFEAAQAMLDAGSRRRRTHVSRAARTLLNGLLFDADGQPMAPVFGQSKRKRRYQYYASRRSPSGQWVEGHDDAIRRVPASAIDELVTGWVAKLRPDDAEPPGPGDVRKVIGRVEIHAAAAHVVIRCRAILGGRRSVIERVRAHLQPGDQLLPDPSHADLVRIQLPIRLVVRGGRKWLAGPGGRPAGLPDRPNARLVRKLRSAHAIVRSCGIAPGGIAPPRSTRAPRSARDRGLAELASLAPDLQKSILTGALTRDDVSGTPLSWVEQRSLLAPGAAIPPLVSLHKPSQRPS